LVGTHNPNPTPLGAGHAPPRAGLSITKQQKISEVFVDSVRPLWYGVTMKRNYKPQPATPEQLQARLELRRSNAAQPHKNKKAYSRTVKHKKAWV